MYLGIETRNNIVYEGGAHWGLRAVLPPPYLFNMQVADSPASAFKLLADNDGDKFRTLIFREESFDPVTMVRRGRPYAFNGNADPQQCPVEPINHNELQKSQENHGVVHKDLSLYYRKFLSIQKETKPLYAAVGNLNACSLWRIVSIDRMYMDEELLTLRPLHSMGVLPDLELSGVSEPWKSKVEETVNKVVDVINVANAESIIELCRHAASSSLFAHFYEDIEQLHKTDLGPLAERAGKEGKRLVASCGKIIADLHSRIKPNVQIGHECRPPSDRDAELAVCSLSCILSDLKLVK